MTQDEFELVLPKLWMSPPPWILLWSIMAFARMSSIKGLKMRLSVG